MAQTSLGFLTSRSFIESFHQYKHLPPQRWVWMIKWAFQTLLPPRGKWQPALQYNSHDVDTNQVSCNRDSLIVFILSSCRHSFQQWMREPIGSGRLDSERHLWNRRFSNYVRLPGKSGQQIHLLSLAPYIPIIVILTQLNVKILVHEYLPLDIFVSKVLIEQANLLKG